MLDTEHVKGQANLVKIAANYLELKRNGSDYVALCPFHTEKSPSFTVHEEYFKCFGCGAGGDVFAFIQGVESLEFPAAVKRVAEMVGISENGAEKPAVRSEQQGKITAIYRYEDEQNGTLYEICRVEPGRHGKPKEFAQRFLEAGKTVWRKHARQVLYHLPAVIEASQVLYVEGEKDADTACAMGFTGTTVAGGCKAPWLPGFSESLRGKRVVVLPDQDPPGLKRGHEVAAALKEIADVAMVHVPQGNDLTEWHERGGTAEALSHLIDAAFQEQAALALDSRGLLTPAEILEISGGYSSFCNPASRPKGLLTGWERLDAMTLGLHPGQLVVLAARPAMGKSAMALNIAQTAAIRGSQVAFFSLEMSREELLTRAVCSAARVDLMKHRTGFLGRDERRRFNAALQEMLEHPLLIDDSTDLSIAKLEERLTQWRKSIRLAVIDYLQLMGSTGKAKENRTQELAAMTRGIKLLARKYGIPILLLSQLNRSAETRPGDHRPQLSDLRESGSIEQDADMVWFIYREEYYKQDRGDLRGQAEVMIAKHRNGPVGKVKLIFLKEYTRFENMAEDVTEVRI